MVKLASKGDDDVIMTGWSLINCLMPHGEINDNHFHPLEWVYYFSVAVLTLYHYLKVEGRILFHSKLPPHLSVLMTWNNPLFHIL